MAKNSLYDHCDVDVVLDKKELTATVSVNFKPHVLESGRVRYTASDVMNAVKKKGVPVTKIVSGLHHPLENDVKENNSVTYVFSLASPATTPVSVVRETKGASKASGRAKNKTKTSTKKTATNS